MATNKVNAYFGTTTALTITVASLASSTSGVGRQATEVDFSAITAAEALPLEVTYHYKITLGTSPTGSRAAYFYVCNSDGTQRDGAVGASDAAFTIPPNLVPAHTAGNKASPATGDVLQGSFTVRLDTPRQVVAIYHDTAVNLDSTGGNHYLKYQVKKADVQAAT